MSDIEKIISEAWENRDNVNQNSDQNLKDTINHLIDARGETFCLSMNELTIQQRQRLAWLQCCKTSFAGMVCVG